MSLEQTIREIKARENEILEEARFGGIAERKILDFYNKYLRNKKMAGKLIKAWELFKEGKL